MGIVGPGFIARHHLEAVRRLGNVEIIGLAGSSLGSSQRKAEELRVPRVYASYQELVNDPAIDVVHNTTPNHLHLPVTMAALTAGKHVISDKPLAMTAADCALLRNAAVKAGVVHAVTFNYRGNALVQEARVRIESGDLGNVVSVHGQYLQDWMTDETVYSWRMDPSRGGRSSALADIGSHWCDLAEHVSGIRISAVLADISTVVSTRYAASAVDGSLPQGIAPVEIETEDLATVLLRFENGARGSLKIGQVLPGHKNDLQLEVNGRRASLRWEQERQNELWLGSHTSPNVILANDASLLSPEAAAYSRLPPGHQEGWADAFFNVVADIYQLIRSCNSQALPATVCDFAQAARTSRIIEAMLDSAVQGGVWTSVL